MSRHGAPGQRAPGERPILELGDFLAAVTERRDQTDSRYAPLIFRLLPGEIERLERICGSHDVETIDTLEGQLVELFRVRHPAVGAAHADFVKAKLAAHGDASCAGNWVYFPWDSKVVHLLERDDFFDVVTSRNQDKITRTEQEVLRTKRVGVVGLSVGGEIAVTLAQEHLCGTIVLADFDGLELSNLNRLNAGVDDLGVNKAHLAARRVAKIDPYLGVVVYDEGVSRDTLPELLGVLDLVVDECDDLDLKYHLREAAREAGVNVVYAADERGLLSVEPYAHVPDLAPFHGRIGRPQARREDYSDPRAHMRALTEWLGGWARISERSRRSVERIGYTLCGYPQLASEPRLAAGQVGHAARRLLLGEPLHPFLEHLDLERQLSAASQAGS